MDTKTITDNVKRDVMTQIILNMRHMRLSLSDAEQLAQDFLEIFPVANSDEFFVKLFDLSKDYKEIRKVFLKYAGPYYEEKRQSSLKTVREHMERGIYE